MVDEKNPLRGESVFTKQNFTVESFHCKVLKLLDIEFCIAIYQDTNGTLKELEILSRALNRVSFINAKVLYEIREEFPVAQSKFIDDYLVALKMFDKAEIRIESDSFTKNKYAKNIYFRFIAGENRYSFSRIVEPAQGDEMCNIYGSEIRQA